VVGNKTLIEVTRADLEKLSEGRGGGSEDVEKRRDRTREYGLEHVISIKLEENRAIQNNQGQFVKPEEIRGDNNGCFTVTSLLARYLRLGMSFYFKCFLDDHP
jgi:hypothetical protein